MIIYTGTVFDFNGKRLQLNTFNGKIIEASTEYKPFIINSFGNPCSATLQKGDLVKAAIDDNKLIAIQIILEVQDEDKDMSCMRTDTNI